MQDQHNYDMQKMGLNDEVKNMKSKLQSATALKAATAQELGKSRGERAEVEKSKAANEEYLQTTKMDCASKAAEWEERQKDAVEEMAVISKAKEILEGGVKAFFQTSVKSNLVYEDDMVAHRREVLVQSLK